MKKSAGKSRLLFPVLTLLVVVWSSFTLSSQRAPLLQEGKTTIYERVLTRPGAELASRPNESGKPIPAFTRYYVYDRQRKSGHQWLEVGPDHQGITSGWIRDEGTVPWRQQLALSFTNPAGRTRVLFFEKRSDLESILESETPVESTAPIHNRIESGKTDNRIIAIEPETYVDIKENFYLLPILESEEIYSGMGRTARVLKVASVTKRDQVEPPFDLVGQNNAKADLLRNFSSALVFVIDSTISMGPYIERTKDAVRRIYDYLKNADLWDKVKFGLIAYRANIQEFPDLVYLRKMFADPSLVKDGPDFLDKVKDLKSAHKSTGAQFDEDAYAGLMMALDQIDWDRFGARYIVLVTDAGAIRGEDPLTSTGLNAKQVRLEASHRRVALYTMHLKTPQGKKNHMSAQRQYEALSLHPSVSRPLYFSVKIKKEGDVEDFGLIVDLLAETIVDQAKRASRSNMFAGSGKIDIPDFGDRKNKVKNDVERLKHDTALLGYAMQLDYLGRMEKTEAPSVVEGWIADVDLEDPLKRAVDVRILLTKNQLSDIQLVLKNILEASKLGLIKPEKFFGNIRSFAARIGRDPNQVTSNQTMRLADLGLLSEYLDDLPYKSDVMNLDQDTWTEWGYQEQIAFINTIRRKMRLYEIYNRDSDRWVSLAPGSHESEHVYPVPIDALP